MQDDLPQTEEQSQIDRFSDITGADAEFVKVDQAALFDMILVGSPKVAGKLLEAEEGMCAFYLIDLSCLLFPAIFLSLLQFIQLYPVLRLPIFSILSPCWISLANL